MNTSGTQLRAKLLMFAAATATVAFAPSSIHAATWCGGTVKGVLLDGGGVVLVYPSFRNDWLQICNLNGPWNGISVDICKSWLATTTALRLTQEPAVFHYSQNVSCAGIPSYGNAYAPAFISINVP